MMGGMMDGVPVATFEGIADDEADDLVAECQALQPLALATAALLLAMESGLEGLWES